MTNEQWQQIISDWLAEPVEISGVDELRDWSQSRVLRITVKTNRDQRIIYAKQSRSEHATEATIYQLAGQVKGFPAPKAKNTVINGEEWLLIEEAAGEQLARCREISRYRDAVIGLAAFHQQSLDEQWLDHLSGLDSVVQRLNELSQTAISAVQACATKGIFTEVDHALANQVQTHLATSWQSICAELASFPVSLIHGDSHSGNIFTSGQAIQFVDWGSAARAPGMIDLVGLLDVAARMRNEIGSHDELKEIYWAQLSPEARRHYGSLGRAYRILQICRSLLELDWFSRTTDDYGRRSNRELQIIADALAALEYTQA
ncbi:MAG: phosphotransferase [Bacillota bacterium]